MIRPARNSAFTLLEMLVALALIGILAGSLYMSLRIGFLARRRAEETILPVRAAALALDLLGRDVVSTLPPTGILAGGFLGEDAELGSSGEDADELVFHAIVDASTDDGSGIRRIDFVVAQDEEGGGVLLRRVTANLLAPTTPEPAEETICRNVKAFKLRYFDGSAWVDGWDSSLRENALPLAVEAELTLRRRDATEGASDDGYKLVRVFLLPCAVSATGEGAGVMLPSSSL
ncbi:MAG: GspJ family type II secretion system protein [Planctomycetota bacterium]